MQVKEFVSRCLSFEPKDRPSAKAALEFCSAQLAAAEQAERGVLVCICVAFCLFALIVFWFADVIAAANAQVCACCSVCFVRHVVVCLQQRNFDQLMAAMNKLSGKMEIMHE